MLRGGCHCYRVHHGFLNVSFFVPETRILCSNKNSRGAVYTDLKDNNPMCESYTSAMNVMGHNAILDAAGYKGVLSGGSTDMGEFLLPAWKYPAWT